MATTTEKNMASAITKHVSYPFHIEPSLIVNRLIREGQTREVGETFLEKLVPREEWKPAPRTKELQPLQTPVSHVRYWKYTNTDACKSKAECIYIMQALQERHISVGYGDIRFNFLIGGDGDIFEGRGWNFKPQEDPNYEFDHENHLEIAFIGDIRIRSKMFDAFRRQLQLASGYALTQYGTRNQLIAPDFRSIWKEK